MPTPVLLADTELLFAAGFSAALATEPDFHVEEVARDRVTLEAALGKLRDAVCVVSPLVSGDLARIAEFTAEQGHRVILLVDTAADAQAFAPASLRGVLRRNETREHMLQCLRAVAAGEIWTGAAHRRTHAPTSSAANILNELTPRQLRAMGFVTQGVKNAEIARYLHTSEQVVKNLLRTIYDRTGVSDRLELALYVLHHPELARAASIAASQPMQAQGVRR